MEYLSKRSLGVLVVGAFLLALVSYLVYSVYISPTGKRARESSDLGQLAGDPIERYVTFEGQEIKIQEFEGQVLIVTFWASWSPFTEGEIEKLASLKAIFGPEITVRAVNRKEEPATAMLYIDTIGKEEGVEYIIDTTDQLYSRMGGYAMPETLLFDTVGNTIAHIRGTLNESDVESIVHASISTP